MSNIRFTRRGLLKTSAIAGAGLAAPTIFTSRANAFTNEPKAGSVTLGFNVPQSGPYADEGADELRAFQLAVEHLNGGGDGGMLQTFSSKTLDGTGIMGKKVEFVTGDTQTKSDAARASAQSMIQKDGGHHDLGRVVVRRRDRRAGAVPGGGHHLHGRSLAFQRYHRQGQEGQRLQALLQRLHVGGGARPGADQGIRQGPQVLHADGRLYLGLDAGGIHEGLHGKGRLDHGAGRAHAAGPRGLFVLHRAGSGLGCRRPDPQPLRRRHGEFAHQRGAVRAEGQAGQRQGFRDRRAALFGADGTRGGGRR